MKPRVGIPVARQNATRKELVPLAFTGGKRHPGLPNVPAFTEAGTKGLESETASWWSVAAPAGLGPEARQRLHAATQAALNDPEVKKGFTVQGADGRDLDAATMAPWIERASARLVLNRRDATRRPARRRCRPWRTSRSCARAGHTRISA